MNFRRALWLLASAASLAGAQTRRRPPLDSAAISDIARLLLLEDVRRFDTIDLERMLAAKHPEVRRRAMLAVAHLDDKRGVALLRARPLEEKIAVLRPPPWPLTLDDKLVKRGAQLFKDNCSTGCHEEKKSSVVRDAWARGQAVVVHGWVYALRDGLLHDLGLCVTAEAEIAGRFEQARAAAGRSRNWADSLVPAAPTWG